MELLAFEDVFDPGKFHVLKENGYLIDASNIEEYAKTVKENRSALRIRKKQEKCTLTLKQPHLDGLLESHQSLSDEEADMLMNETATLQGDIAALLEEQGIDTARIRYFGSLTTKRAEFPYKNGLLVLDHSFYLNKDDYELEFEADDFTVGQTQFMDLLHEFSIPVRPTANKIRRFYELKYSQQREELAWTFNHYELYWNYKLFAIFQVVRCLRPMRMLPCSSNCYRNS